MLSILFGLMLSSASAADSQILLDFDKEISKHERQVSVKFNKGVSSTYKPIKYYRACRPYAKKSKAAYSSCNASLESKRYNAWVAYWKNQNGVVGQGPLNVRLVESGKSRILTSN